MTRISSYSATAGAFLAIAAIVAAFPEPAAASDDPDALGHLMQPAFNETPISIGTYRSLSPAARQAYLAVSVEALRWSGEFSGCEGLTPHALGIQIGDALTEHFPSNRDAAPMMEPLVLAAMTLCPR